MKFLTEIISNELRNLVTYHRLGIFTQNIFHSVQSGNNTLIAGDFTIFHWNIEVNAIKYANLLLIFIFLYNIFPISSYQ